jgi:hypothetical protein
MHVASLGTFSHGGDFARDLGARAFMHVPAYGANVWRHRVVSCDAATIADPEAGSAEK